MPPLPPCMNTTMQTRETKATRCTSASVRILFGLDWICRQFFEFNGNIFHQHGGVSIGPKMAPPYSCLGMGELEQRLFNSNNDDLNKILLWKRFIDDIFLIWLGTATQLEEFHSYLNSVHPTIKFDKPHFDKDTNSCNFLDLSICINLFGFRAMVTNYAKVSFIDWVS